MFKFCRFFSVLLGLLVSQVSVAEPIRIVAAENFYGSIAEQIGGVYVKVLSVISHPDQDPHLFTVSPRVAKHIAQADLVVFNGLGYDAWIQGLLTLPGASHRVVICVADLTGKKQGANPHIWYDLKTMSVYAGALLAYLAKKDPEHYAIFQKNYQQFINQLDQLARLVTSLRKKTVNLNVIATEPVFGYMASSLGFIMLGKAFQQSMMNSIDPTIQQVVAFRNDLQSRRANILFYNKQVNSPMVQQLVTLAKQHAIPVIGVTETQPPHSSYINWMNVSLMKIAQHGLKQVQSAETGRP